MEAFKVTLSTNDYPYLVIVEDIEDVVPILHEKLNNYPYCFFSSHIDKIERINDYSSRYIIVQDGKQSETPENKATSPVEVLAEVVTNPNENGQIKAEDANHIEGQREAKPINVSKWTNLIENEKENTSLTVKETGEMEPKTETPISEPKEETPSHETNNKHEDDYDVPHLSPDGREPLKSVKVGDIVAYWENWKGSQNKGLLLVKTFDYGNGDLTVNKEHPYGASAPRCLWGKSAIGGTFYGDYAPGALYYYPATEEEKAELLASIPPSMTSVYNNFMEKVQARENQSK